MPDTFVSAFISADTLTPHCPADAYSVAIAITQNRKVDLRIRPAKQDSALQHSRAPHLTPSGAEHPTRGGPSS